MAVRACAWFLSVLFLAACSKAEPSNGLRGPGSGLANNTAGTNGIPVAGSTGGTGTGAFGNGDGVPPPAPVENPDAGGCVVGQFCPPTTVDTDDCGSLVVEGDVDMVEVPGNVLLVFDRSLSMDMDWNGMTRWQAAGTAMVDALMPIADKLTIGAVLFPSPDPNAFLLDCTVNPIDAADQITFKPGPDALTELQSGGAGGVPKYEPIRLPAAGATPTSEGVQMADAALNAATLMGTTAVIIVTDGEPNCLWNQQQTTDTIAGWLSQKSIKTYVVGLPGVGGQGPMNLEALAVAGGTSPYLTPTNTAELQMKIAEIVSTTVTVGFDSCTINLDPPAAVPEKLHLVVTDMGIDQDVPHVYPNGDAAWTISPDGATVEMVGVLCEAAMTGLYQQINFKFGCVDLPPAPPPMGPT